MHVCVCIQFMQHSEICFISIRLCGIIYVAQPVALPFCRSLAVSAALCCLPSLCPVKRHCPLTKQIQLQHSHTRTHTLPQVQFRTCATVCVCVCASACELCCAAPWPLNVCNKAQVWRRACGGSQAHKGRKGVVEREGKSRREGESSRNNWCSMFLFFLVQANLHFRYTCNIVATIALSTPSRLLSRPAPSRLNLHTLLCPTVQSPCCNYILFYSC